MLTSLLLERGRIRLLQSLTIFDHSRRFRELLENRHPDSGAWLLEHETVKQWIAFDGPRGIWCSGIRQYTIPLVICLHTEKRV